MRRADLSLTVRQRKLPCVIDPALVLCHAQGPLIAQRLTQVVEPWLTRSFWQVLDASELLLHHHSGTLIALTDAQPSARAPQPVPEALLEWMRLRDSTDAGSWLFRWVGDSLAESQTHDDADAQIVDRYEMLAQSWAQALGAWPLEDGCTQPWVQGFDAVASAMDTLVLSATLGGAVVISLCEKAGEPPWPVQALSRVGINAKHHALAPHSLFAAERTLLRDALAVAGLAPIVETLPPLAAVHVLPPPDRGNAPMPDDDVDTQVLAWSRAMAWWYLISGVAA
jgi:hypothetical protein